MSKQTMLKVMASTDQESSIRTKKQIHRTVTCHNVQPCAAMMCSHDVWPPQANVYLELGQELSHQVWIKKICEKLSELVDLLYTNVIDHASKTLYFIFPKKPRLMFHSNKLKLYHKYQYWFRVRAAKWSTLSRGPLCKYLFKCKHNNAPCPRSPRKKYHRRDRKTSLKLLRWRLFSMPPTPRNVNENMEAIWQKPNVWNFQRN